MSGRTFINFSPNLMSGWKMSWIGVHAVEFAQRCFNFLSLYGVESHLETVLIPVFPSFACVFGFHFFFLFFYHFTSPLDNNFVSFNQIGLHTWFMEIVTFDFGDEFCIWQFFLYLVDKRRFMVELGLIQVSVPQ